MRIGLRCRQKRAHTDIHHQPALDVVHDFSGDVGLVAVGFFDLSPDAAAAHTLVGQQNVAILAVARALHLDWLPGL